MPITRNTSCDSPASRGATSRTRPRDGRACRDAARLSIARRPSSNAAAIRAARAVPTPVTCASSRGDARDSAATPPAASTSSPATASAGCVAHAGAEHEREQLLVADAVRAAAQQPLAWTIRVRCHARRKRASRGASARRTTDSRDLRVVAAGSAGRRPASGRGRAMLSAHVRVRGVWCVRSRCKAAARADGTPLAPIGDDVLLGTHDRRVPRRAPARRSAAWAASTRACIRRSAAASRSRCCRASAAIARDLVERFFAEAQGGQPDPPREHRQRARPRDAARRPAVHRHGVSRRRAARGDHRPRAPARHAAAARRHRAARRARCSTRSAPRTRKGIVHRDLKPDNIFVTPAGHAEGARLRHREARSRELGGSATHTGSLLGTPHYMSPEQAAGAARRPARRHLRDGRDPVRVRDAGRRRSSRESLFDLLRKHVEAPPPSPRALRPDMPAALEHVILHGAREGCPSSGSRRARR